LTFLVVARIGFPVPSRLEKGGPSTAHRGGFTRSYWLYMIAGSFFGAGLMSFEFLSFHLTRVGIGMNRIPALLAMATAFGVVASLVLGRAYDKRGITAVVVAVVVVACFPPLIFFGGLWLIVAGLLLWGGGYAIQDTLLKAVIASVLPEGRRNTAFGIFYVGYGAAWLIGSAMVGTLYDRSRLALVVFAMLVQLVSVPFFIVAARQNRRAS
jgi:predicted MFS family arabinose efflux permease